MYENMKPDWHIFGTNISVQEHYTLNTMTAEEAERLLNLHDEMVSSLIILNLFVNQLLNHVDGKNYLEISLNVNRVREMLDDADKAIAKASWKMVE